MCIMRKYERQILEFAQKHILLKQGYMVLDEKVLQTGTQYWNTKIWVLR